MESGTIVRWLKSEGDRIEKGEPLYELDTEKVTQEVEADFAGVLLKILAQEGEEVEVGKPVAVIGEAGEQVEEREPAKAAAKVEESAQEEGSAAPAREAERERGRAASTAEQVTEVKPPAARRTDGRVKASPLARRLARERGIDIAALAGTGPEGRIVAEDVERAAAAPAPAAPAAAAPPPGEVEVVKLSQMRRTIARRLTEAWQIPAFQISMSADMTRARELHESLAERATGEAPKPTITDILTKACAAALMRHRAVNARFADDAVELYPNANIGIAVAVPDGLVVPVIRQAERRTLAELAEARADIVSRARENKLRQDDLEDGTFTISNLGMYGVEQFIAVLNPPQAAILAVGAIEEKPVIEDDELDVRALMTLTLTCDHRAVDGATAADFLRTAKSFLEEPGLML
jgi:pyruvate dehydrogenase E2 component (dihydrolipoamide acetyltransferase)